MRLVNGYYCSNCSEELQAKRGVDPASGPHRAELEEQNERRQKAQPTDGVELGLNRPGPSGDLGSRLNLFA